MLKTIMSEIQGGDWFVTINLKDAYFHIQVVRRHRKFLRFAFGGKAYNTRFWPGLGAEDIHKVHGCCAGPFEAPGHSCTQLLGRLVDYIRYMIIYDYDRCIDDRLGRSL